MGVRRGLPSKIQVRGHCICASNLKFIEKKETKNGNEEMEEKCGKGSRNR